MKAYSTLEKQAEAFFLKDLFNLGKTISKEEYKSALRLLSEKQKVRNDIDFSKLKGVLVFRKGSKNSTIQIISDHAITMYEEMKDLSYFKKHYNAKAIQKILEAYYNDERIESTLELLKA